MLILILFNFGIILWIYFKFFKENKEVFEENIKDLEPLEMAYINDRSLGNNFDSILAEIINLNIKGHLSIEYNNNDYIIKEKFNTPNNISNYELLVLKFLFSKKTEISKTELEEMIASFDLYDIQINELEEEIQSKLIKENIIDKAKKEKLKKFGKAYKRLSLLFILIIVILKMTIFETISFAYIIIYLFEEIISNILLMKADYYTDKGKNLRKQIIDYKQQIMNKEFFTDNKSMKEIVNEKEFANSLALHIKTTAKDTFIYNKIIENTANKLRKITPRIISAFLVMMVVFFLLRGTMLAVDKTGKLLIFVILLIIVAAWADITNILATFRNTNKK